MNDPVLCFLVVNTAVSLGLALGALACSWGRARPSIVHLLWLAALVKLITPSVVPVPMWPAATAATAAAAGPEIEILAVVPLESGGVSSGAAAPPLYSSKDVVPVVGRSVFLRPWVLGLWAAGSAAWAGLALWRMGRFHRLLRGAQPLDATTPCVFAVEAAISPLLWAFLGRARIVVPKALFNVLSDAEFEAVLCHERAHYRRRDHWVRWIEFAVMSALWWHPLVWWISRRLRAAEEACCDAEVVADLPDRRPYASALLRTALFISESAPLPRTATGIGRPASIQHRVHTIMNAPVPRRLSFGASSALLAATAFVVLAAPVEIPGLLPEAQLAEEPPAPAPDSFASTSPKADRETPPEASPPLNLLEDAPLLADAAHTEFIEQQYLSGYIKTQQAEGRKNAGDPEEATGLFKEALAIFESIRTQAPAWQPNMVEYRIHRVQRNLALPPSLPVLATMVVTPLAAAPNQTHRLAIKGTLRDQPWALVADRVMVVTPRVKPSQSSTVVGGGSVRGGWGTWRLAADALDIDGSIITLTGDPVLIVDTQLNPPPVILKGNRVVIDTHSEMIKLIGSAVAIQTTSEWQTREPEGFIELPLPGRREHKARMTAGTHTIGGSNADRLRAAAELLKTWPEHQVLEDELRPLLQKPTALPLPEPVDAPRQEPLPNESTPLKKLPG